MADGMAAFARHWGAQQTPKDKSGEQEKLLRLLKGLAEAKSRVDQVTIEDAQFPDLYDQLAAQSEPQNYFFEPYATQWCPQIVRKGNLIPLPSVIATSLEEELQTLTLSGLLPAIDHAWTSVDHRLFLWSYKHRGRFAVFEMDQPVVAVGLCAVPKTGVFTDKVKHLLVVATTVEVVLVAVLYEDNKTLASGLRLQRTKLSVSTDNTVVRRIASTAAHGRIFFGGADGGVYELLYGPSGAGANKSSDGLDASLFIPSFLQRSGCRKVAHTSQLANYLPSFLSALAGSPTKLLEFAIDDDRHILYALHEQGDVDVFDLGAKGNDMKLVCTVNLIQDGAKYARENRRTRVSCPDERLFQGGSNQLKIVSLAVVNRNESALVTLVALASNGMRFYLTVHSRRTYTMGSSIPPSKRPTRLEILYIRLPPPAITLADAPPYHAKEGMQPGFAPGKSPSSVHFGFYKHGVALLVDGAKDQQDRVVGLAHDPVSHSTVLAAASVATRGKQTIRESVALESSIGKIVDVQELDDSALEQSKKIRQLAIASSSRSSSAGAKRSYDEMSNGFSSSVLGADAVPIVGEVALQYSAPSRHFLCLSNAGIQVFKKIRPIDQLHRVLLLSRGHDLKATLAPFVRSFGEIQVCCMLIALACGVQSDPLTVDGSTAAAAAASAASVVHKAGVKSDEYIFTTAMQGIFECGQIARAAGAATDSADASAASSASTRIVLTTDFGMSYQHDGLVMFLTRVLRPMWFPKTIGRRGASSSSTYEPAHTKESLDEVREVLFQLRQLMETAGPYAVSIGSGAVLVENAIDEFGDAIHGDEASRAAELTSRYHKLRNEEQRKREMRFKAEQRSLFLLYQLVLRSIEAISLLRLAMDFQVAIEETFARLSFGDLVSTAEGTSAAKLMIKALLKGRDENNQFLVQQLREQCPSFFTVSDLWHYQGYKSLATAKLSAPGGRKAHLNESLRQFLNACHMWDTEDCIGVLQGICDDYALLNFYEGVVKLSLACAQTFHDAAATDLSGIKLTWKRNCFGCILLTLQRLMESGKSGQSPQAVEEMISLDDSARRSYVEEVLHFALVSEDSDFHTLLYAWLYEHGHTQILTSIRSPFIEDFLKDRDQDLLIKMYMEQQKYLVAAKVWWARAHEDNEDEGMNGFQGNPDVLKRQYYVSKALGCLKSVEDVSEAADAIREVRDVLDVLQLQVRVLKALEQATVELEASAAGNIAIEAEIQQRKQDLNQLSFKIFDATTLYNQFASKYDMWSECLHIIHACNSEEADVVELLWRKIIFDMVPSSASSPDFNAWRLDQCEQAGLPASTSQQPTSIAMSFESGYWIGQMQMKILRLGKSLYTDAVGADAHSAALSTFVVPVGFLAKQLERIASWHLRLTHTAAHSWPGSSFSSNSTSFNWILKMFLDIGIPHRVLLSYYERLYREQGSVEWTLHLLQSVYAILVLWKKHASSARAANDQLAEYAACCPHIVAMCDDIVTDLKALSSDGRAEVHLLLDHFRRYKSDVMNLRNPL